MSFHVLTGDFTITSRNMIVVTFLTSGTLAWFFLLQIYLVDIFYSVTLDLFLVDIGKDLFFGFGVFSAIFGSLIAKKINRRKFLMTWIIFGIISTIALITFQGAFFFIISSVLLGLSLGLGLPSSLAFLSEWTSNEERGRVAGITILETFVIAFPILTFVEILKLDIMSIIILFSIIRSISLIALILHQNEEIKEKRKPELSRNDYREFGFYLIPWIMFVVAASTASNVITASTVLLSTESSLTQSYESAIMQGNVFRYAFIAIFGFVSGIIIDRIGRKQTIIIGLISLGIGFGLLGFVLLSSSTILVYFLTSGIAWGSFFTVFLVIPGDLSNIKSREIFYALGTISPLIILFSFSMIDTTWMLDLIEDISPSYFSQILSIILFVSIVPVMRAKETLTESKKQERKMKEHIDRIGKFIQNDKD